MLPSVKASSEMEKLKQLNSFLVKELKDSKNEIAKLKGENKVLKEKYEKMRDNIKKLISPEYMELKIGDSPDKKSLSLPDEITNKDIEIISIEEEEGTSNSKDNFNKNIEFPFHKIIDTILNPSTDKQSTTIDKFHKPKEINTIMAVAPINKSTKESDSELITKETITNIHSRSFDAMNYGNDAFNAETTKSFGNAGSTSVSASISGGEKSPIQQPINVRNFDDDMEMTTSNSFLVEKIGSKHHAQITAKKSFIALNKPEDDKGIPKEKISSKVPNDKQMEMTSTESLLIKWIEEKITHPHQSIQNDTQSNSLKNHIESFHDGKKPFKCATCYQAFSQRSSLKTHFKIHDHEIQFYKCKFCDNNFLQSNSLQSHIKTAHESKKIEAVHEKINPNISEDNKEISKEKISSKVETNDEEMEMTGAQFLPIKWIEEKITHPHQSIDDNSKIQTNIDTNNEEKEMICPLCFQIFTKITRFENHIIVHKGSMPELNQETQCPASDCDLTFPNRVDLCRHYQKAHNEEATPCGICLKVFRNTKMKLHLFSHHSTNKPMKLQKIKIKEKLSKRRKNKENERRNKSRLEREATQKFPCEICQQTFTKRSSVKTHIDTVHLKLKPYKCEDCGKEFLQASHLNFHSDMHNNIRFKCTFCKKDFSRRHVLNQHVKKHTENKLKDHISNLFNKS